MYIPEQFQNVMKKLNTELEEKDMGDNRMYKFVRNFLGNDHKTVNFFIQMLGFKRWQANKIKYTVAYHKRKYQERKIQNQKLHNASSFKAK